MSALREVRRLRRAPCARLSGGDFDGESLEMDSVGVLQEKGENRLVMILDASPDRYEIYELVR